MRRALQRRYGRATLASAGAFARPGAVVRYVGHRMPLGGIEGRVVIPAGETDPHAALIQWATHASALRQKGTAAYWEPEWIPHDELKPLRKLSKGFAFYKPEMQEGHRVWVRDIT